MQVIGVAGQARFGKDVVADKLAELLNTEHNVWQRRAFASAVKEVYCDMFGVDANFIEEWKVKKEIPPGFDMAVRPGLQFIGDGFRQIKSTIWLDLAFKNDEPKIFSDTRYRNEWTRVNKEGGLNILIARPSQLNDDPNKSESEIRPYVDWCLNNLSPYQKFVDLHLAFPNFEVTDAPAGMELFDVFIRNDGTLEELHTVIETDLLNFVNHFKFKS